MHSTIAIFFASVASFLNAASAVPVMIPRLESLTITFPTAGEGFGGGATTHVGWETTPAIIDSSAMGMITLSASGFGADDQTTELAILAQNFSLADGFVSVIIPSDLSRRDDYFVTLIDMTGNFAPGSSGDFEIFPPIS